jgi:hypothetical protein
LPVSTNVRHLDNSYELHAEQFGADGAADRQQSTVTPGTVFSIPRKWHDRFVQTLELGELLRPVPELVCPTIGTPFLLPKSVCPGAGLIFSCFIPELVRAILRFAVRHPMLVSLHFYVLLKAGFRL